MADDLVRVRFKSGKEATVGADYPRVWPEDIDVVLDDAPDLAPDPGSTPDPNPAQAPKVAAPKEKK